MIEELSILEQEEQETERIIACLAEHGRDAQEEMLAKGIRVMIARDHKLMWLYPDHHTEVIRELED